MQTQCTQKGNPAATRLEAGEGPRASWEGGAPPVAKVIARKLGKCLEQERTVGPQPVLPADPLAVPRQVAGTDV